MDALTSWINALNLRAKLAYSGGVCGRWLMEHTSDSSVWFHLVSKGQGWVHSPRWDSALALTQGDLILFLPQAEKHALSYSPIDLPCDMTNTELTSWQAGDTGFVCGEILLDSSTAMLWQSLPTEIVIRRTEAGEILANLIELIILEAVNQRFGSDSVIERLSDSLFVLVIRHCIEQGLAQKGIFAAMQDRRLSTVLRLIHQQPWQHWTIADFCSQAGVSKTVLSSKFTELIGIAPIEYLTVWRMQIAARWLKESNKSIEKIAEQCGYDSAAAFSKAFKRCLGISPSLFRRETK